MAYTAGTGFRFWRSLSGAQHAPAPIPVRIANSTTLRVGDIVRINTSGLLVANGATNPAAGVLVGFQDQNGITPFSLGYNKGGVTLTGDDTLATSSTNTTRTDFIMGQVIVDVSGDILWLNDSDANLAQTNLGQYCDLDSNSRQAAMSSPSDATGVLQLLVIDPKGTTIEPNNPETADASVGAFRIARNQYGVLVDSATAKLAA